MFLRNLSSVLMAAVVVLALMPATSVIGQTKNMSDAHESGGDAANPFSEDRYSRRIWQTQDGVPQDTISALVQTNDGYLWVGTSGGLARFDGFRFTVFDRENTPALREQSVYSLFCTRDGTLWIGTEGGGLIRYRSGIFRIFGAGDGLTNGFVRVVREDKHANLWVGTDRGLFRLADDKLTRVDNHQGIPSMSVHAIYEDSKGRLWVGGSGLLLLSEGVPTVYRSNRSLADNSIRAIAESNDGTIWVATIGGLHSVANGDPQGVFTSRAIIPNNTTYLYRTKDGDLWAGTYGQGLFRYRGRAQTIYRAPALLPDNYILALLEDREGNFWVGTKNGLLRLSRSVVSTVATGPPGAPESIMTIYQDRDQSIWMTTLGGRLYHLRGDQPLPPALSELITRMNVRTLFRDLSGAIWVGTNGEGVARIASGKVTHYTMKQGLINDFVRAFCESRDGSIWIGTDSGLSRWQAGSFRNFHTAEGLAYGSIRALLEDRHGSLWVGTDGGVSRYHAGMMIRDERVAALAGEKVWSIHEDPAGGLWFGTLGAGLFLLQSGKLSSFTTRHGLGSNNIQQILEDRNGNLWMSSLASVFSVNREDLMQCLINPNRRPAISIYGTSEGMETSQMIGGVQPAGTISAGGDIWFPTTRGAVRINPNQTLQAGAQPVLIEKLLVDGRESQTVEVAPGDGRVEIHYTAIRLRSSERIRFRYKLEGFDQEWTEAEGRRVAYYTNLPPGPYRFSVAAYEVDNPRAASEAAVAFRLLPHFYQTWWFVASCLALLAAGGLAAYRLRLRQMRMRFAAVLAERNRLAREMHDTLIQGCVGVSTLLDAAASLQQTSPDVTRDLLERARTQVRESVDEARRAVWNLRHETSGDGLVTSLERLAQQITLTSGVSVSCHSGGTPVPLDAEVEHDLVMIAKEAMLNAVNHGHPQSVRLAWNFEPNRLHVLVTDDGCGFEPLAEKTEQGEHYGLEGINERAKQMGGTFVLSSSPGKGTQVSVTVPIKTRANV